jgi:hypothetical protein
MLEFSRLCPHSRLPAEGDNSLPLEIPLTGPPFSDGPLSWRPLQLCRLANILHSHLARH